MGFTNYIIKDETTRKFLTNNRSENFRTVNALSDEDFMSSESAISVYVQLKQYLNQIVEHTLRDVMLSHRFGVNENKYVDILPVNWDLLEFTTHKFQILKNNGSNLVPVTGPASGLISFGKLINDVVNTKYRHIKESQVENFNIFLFMDLVDNKVGGTYFTTNNIINDPGEIPDFKRANGEVAIHNRFSYHFSSAVTEDDRMMFKLSGYLEKLSEINLEKKIEQWNKFMSYVGKEGI